MNNFVTKIPKDYKIRYKGRKFGNSELSGESGVLEPHHVFGAANRTWSDYYDLVIWLTAAEHRVFTLNTDMKLIAATQAKYQGIYEKSFTRRQWMRNFGKNYIL